MKKARKSRLSFMDIEDCIDILNQVHRGISTKDHTFICCAIEHYTMHTFYEPLGNYLVKWIEKLLGRKARTLDTWYFETYQQRMSDAESRKARLDWIKWMIAELNKELDTMKS